MLATSPSFSVGPDLDSGLIFVDKHVTHWTIFSGPPFCSNSRPSPMKLEKVSHYLPRLFICLGGTRSHFVALWSGTWDPLWWVNDWKPWKADLTDNTCTPAVIRILGASDRKIIRSCLMPPPCSPPNIYCFLFEIAGNWPLSIPKAVPWRDS